MPLVFGDIQPGKVGGIGRVQFVHCAHAIQFIEAAYSGCSCCLHNKHNFRKCIFHVPYYTGKLKHSLHNILPPFLLKTSKCLYHNYKTTTK